MNKLHISVSPHIHGSKTTQKIMLDVILALIPAVIASVVYFGVNAILLIAVCVITCCACELLFNMAIKKQQTVSDLSAVVTGLLLALNLSASTPLWQAALGSVFAIVVVKCIFGGLGKNVVNPAITARVFMTIAFSASMAQSAFPDSVDATSGATALTVLANNEAVNILDLFLGNCGGAIGETCKLALLMGGIYLIAKKVISWHIPVSVIGTVFLFSLILEKGDVLTALAWVLSGGLVLGAFFMATDYVTSPSTAKGKIIFGIGVGLLTVVIRTWSNYPEGVSFAILLMNIFNPYIEQISNRKVFGGGKK